MKPCGVFHGTHRPAWARFAILPDWDDFDAAASDSRLTDIRWVLYIGSPPPTQRAVDFLPDLVRRLDKSGVRPYLVGVCYAEEWYGQWKSGRLGIPGLSPANPDHWLTAAAAIRGWTGQQHVAIKAALPDVPIVWLDSYVNDDLSFGASWYQPVPDAVDVLALEAYVSATGTFASDCEPFLQHAVATRREPIALVVQGFAVDGDPLWSRGPTSDGITGTARWLQHPRVISAWVFDWGSRGNGLRGLENLECRHDLCGALGVTV